MVGSRVLHLELWPRRWKQSSQPPPALLHSPGPPRPRTARFPTTSLVLSSVASSCQPDGESALLKGAQIRTQIRPPGARVADSQPLGWVGGPQRLAQSSGAADRVRRSSSALSKLPS